jgi:hypothetical protein
LVFASDAGAAPKSVFSSAGIGSMTTDRKLAMAAPLPNGEVLIAGGYNSANELLSSAELFNPQTGTFSSLGLGSMATARFAAAAAPLPNGDVLIAGGDQCFGCETAHAELFNPETGTFSEAGVGFTAEYRTGASAAPLPDGEVLIAGGGANPFYPELFNPKTDSFTTAGLVAQVGRRQWSVAAPLPNGKVLIAGGWRDSQSGIASAELVDPETGIFSSAGVGSMTTERFSAAAAPLPDGNVLVAGGGLEEGGIALPSAELFDPQTNTFSSSGVGSMTTSRKGAVAAPLPDGRVLIAGGESAQGKFLSSAELFEPAPEAVTQGGSFGDQTVGEPAGVQSVTVTNVGAQPLEILSGVSLEGSGKAAFSVLSSTCVPGRQLTFQATCAITVSFTPPSAGAFSAQLVASDDAEAPISASLSGTGVPANSGPAGSTGASGGTGASGNAGAAGLAGVAGAIGPQGPAGNEGPAGKPGAPGKEGAAGEVELVKCTVVPVKATGKRKAKTVQRCTTSLVSGPVSFTTGSSARATLSRRSHTYAAGTVRRVHGRQQVVLTASGDLAPGRYTLTITRGSGKSRTTTRQTITIA